MASRHASADLKSPSAGGQPKRCTGAGMTSTAMALSKACFTTTHRLAQTPGKRKRSAQAQQNRIMALTLIHRRWD